jgi:hypothetical protein
MDHCSLLSDWLNLTRILGRIMRGASWWRGVWGNDFWPFVLSLFSILYSLFSILYSLFSILYSLFSILYSLFSILYSLFSILYSLFSILYSLFSVLHSLFSFTYPQFPSLISRKFSIWPICFIQFFYSQLNFIAIKNLSILLFFNLNWKS